MKAVIRQTYTTLCAVALWAGGAMVAHAAPPLCADAADRACLTGVLTETAAQITEPNWRDQTYREIAKLMTTQGRFDDALGLIPLVQNPDTRAMTIRGIGMAAAALRRPAADYEVLFTRLRAEADKIDHPPSLAIALTYIAMAQALAGDDAGATKTAQSMENAALRNKAFAESAEIQAARENLPAALASITHINDPVFRDKAHRTIAKILSDNGHYDKALAAAQQISNNYQRAQALLPILARQVAPEEQQENQP